MFEERSGDGDDGPGVGGLTRRDYLVASGASVGLGLAGHYDPELEAAPLEEVVLRREDLRLPDEDPYVDRGADPADALLIKHFRRTVPGFTEVDVALSGFATTNRAEVPTHVETAAIGRERTWTPEALGRATDAWLRGDDRDARAVQLDRAVGPGGVQWLSRGTDGALDVLRLRATPPGPVLVTVAHGYEDAALGPTDAVSRYERTMQERVRA